MDNHYLGENLVFIISPPRAGSTMLQRIIGAHSDIHTVAEPWIMLHPVYAMRNFGINSEYNSQWAYGALNEFLESINSDNNIVMDAVRSYAQTLYGHAMRNRKESLFLDKTPRYYLIMNELFDLFPSSKFILLKRNPMAVLASLFHSWIKEDYYKLSRFKVDLIKSVDCALNIKSKSKYFASVKYEQLVFNPEKYVRQICETVNLSYEPSMLDYGKKQPLKGKKGDSVNARRLNQISSQFLDRWQETLQSNPIYWCFANFYLELIGPEKIELLGYSFNDLQKKLNSKSFFLNTAEKKTFHKMCKDLLN